MKITTSLAGMRSGIIAEFKKQSALNNVKIKHKKDSNNQVYKGPVGGPGQPYLIKKLWGGNARASLIPVKNLSYMLRRKIWTDRSESIQDYLKGFKGKQSPWIEKSDLSYPVILGPDKTLLDGYHRLAKAILHNKDKILATKYDKWKDLEFARS